MSIAAKVSDEDLIEVVSSSKSLYAAHQQLMQTHGVSKNYYRTIKRRAKRLNVQPGGFMAHVKVNDEDFIDVITNSNSLQEACDELVRKYKVSPHYYSQMTGRAKKLGVKPRTNAGGSSTTNGKIKVPDSDFINIVTSSKNYRQAGLRLIAKYGLSSAYVNNVKPRAIKLGVKPGIQHEHDVPEDFHIKASSTLVGKDGKTKLQWLKLDKDKADMIKELKDFAKGLAKSIKGKSTLIAPPIIPGSDLLLTNYIEPEPHFGMLSWAKETRENYDSKIAKQLLQGAAKRLVDAAPNSKFAQIVGLGDGIHADNQLNETTSGNKLDTDSRWSKIIQAYAGFYKWWIEYLLTKHDIVYITRVKGNHDDHSTTAVNLMLGYMFENNPRVIIDQTEQIVKYHRFGKNLMGITHGDKSKGDNLPLLMASDEPQAWGETEFRSFYTGHIHHLSRKEYIGCVVESFRSLAAKDSWHAGQGYRAGREMVMNVLHRDHGEIERHTCNVSQVA